MKKIGIILLSFHLLSGSVCASQWIRVNQKGYLPDDVKVAVWLTDYAVPEINTYRSSEHIYKKILNYEQMNMLNAFMLLVYIGTDEKRADKYYYYLDKLIETLKSKGYELASVDKLL